VAGWREEKERREKEEDVTMAKVFFSSSVTLRGSY